MADFVPAKKTAEDFNNGNYYQNMVDSVQAETINNLIEGVLYADDKRLYRHLMFITNGFGEIVINMLTEDVDAYNIDDITSGKLAGKYVATGFYVNEDEDIRGSVYMCTIGHSTTISALIYDRMDGDNQVLVDVFNVVDTVS